MCLCIVDIFVGVIYIVHCIFYSVHQLIKDRLMFIVRHFND